MSDLQRSALAARIARLPHLPSHAGHENEDEDEDEGDTIGILPPGLGHTTTSRRSSAEAGPSPLSAASYFSQALEVDVPDSGLTFRVYYTPPRPSTRGLGTVLVCHHGAGYSALSFACLAKEIAEASRGECGLLAFDARRHGKTFPSSSSNSGDNDNLDIQVLTTDFENLIAKVFPEPARAPSLLLVGHSMGGAVIVRACPQLLERKYRVTGVVVLDVVEGSAIEALPHMHSLLNSRPDGFESAEAAITWHLSNHTIRNPTSARISVPSLITPAPTSPSNSKPQLAYIWRTPLKSTSAYWLSWFQGLSSAFLAARTARLLILAGTDRLDKELMIGQMQGKFQMEVIPDTGHMLHEDDPEKVARILLEFWKRNERVIVGVKKVGES
ncbi:protein phosphatase methylesterase [Sistotremastrum suecicum HHB10207 ss-3]|uniref:Protein phosphatase methylesterase 1 n=1 Tax=Sistotremastrum suecicum HHB10207 ss-3 TaxID=1314776 RepID=A0A166DS83_9AGAM|nr:protein phosphatase methylesterase [Sistotremastrum suecicum HHB10207 ss-3]